MLRWKDVDRTSRRWRKTGSLGRPSTFDQSTTNDHITTTQRYDEREHIDQPRFSTISSSASICTAWTVRRTILDQPVLVDHSSDPNRPLGRSAPLCYDDQRERKLGLLQRQKQKDHPTSTFPTAHRVDSLSPWDVSIEIWILSLSTTKRRYPPTPPSFDMQHGLYRSISHWYTSTDKKEKKRDPDSQGSVERFESEWSGSRGKGSIGRLGPGVMTPQTSKTSGIEVDSGRHIEDVFPD
jgi:hypothetical protein